MSGLEAVAPSCRQDASPRLVKAKYGPAPSLHFPLSGRGLRLRLPRRWPWAGALASAFARLQALPSG